VVEYPSQINGDNLKILRPETNRIFRKKKREYMKGNINELKTKIKTKMLKVRTEAQIIKK
jgi:hypothetical protein